MLSVGVQNDPWNKPTMPCVWFLCNPDNVEEDIVFFTIGTGQNMPEDGREYQFVGTYQLYDNTSSPFVGHVFIIRE